METWSSGTKALIKAPVVTLNSVTSAPFVPAVNISLNPYSFEE